MGKKWLSILLASALLLSGCSAPRNDPPETGGNQTAKTGYPSGEEVMYVDTTENVIYLAGGCFWGIEALMQSIPGVIDAQSGYANGADPADANYPTVCGGDTGFRETVL